MHRSHRRLISSAGVVCRFWLMLGMAGCNIPSGPPVGETRTISQSIPLGQQKAVSVEIKMGAGKLNVEGGATGLMTADFTYNVDAWKPEVRYETSGDQGNLTIQQPNGSHHYRGSTRNDWDIRLNNQVDIEMNINMGAGQSKLNLAGLNLSKLALNVGAGEADLDLDGAWHHDLAASVHGGVGKLTLHLPSTVGVRVTVEGGLGDIRADGFSKKGNAYTNSAYGESRVNLNIDVQGGMGEVNLVHGGGGTI